MLQNLEELNIKVTSQIIRDLINDHKNNKLPKYQKMLKYYKGKHDIEDRKFTEEFKPNNKLENDYPGYIIDTIHGYFMGIPIRYSSKSKNENYLNEILDIFEDNNEADHNAELAKYMGIYGEAYELVYLNEEGNIRITRLDNEETILVFEPNFQRSVQMALRYYDIKDVTSGKLLTKVELYLPDRIQYYIQDEDKFKLETEEEHFFGKVPVIYYQNNEECMGDFEKVISLIDDYDKKLSDNSNELEDFRNAYLKIVNMNETEPEDVAKCRQQGAFMVGAEGDVSFITKNVNDNMTEHHMQRVNSNIHKFSKVPDLSDAQFAGNLSGVAIKYKLWPIEQIAAIKERKFKTGVKRRFRLISNIQNIKGKDYDWRDIVPTFTRNIPSNDLEAADMASKLNGIVSHETLLGTLPFVDSPSDELARIKKEQEDDLDYTIFSEAIPTKTEDKKQ